MGDAQHNADDLWDKDRNGRGLVVYREGRGATGKAGRTGVRRLEREWRCWSG